MIPQIKTIKESKKQFFSQKTFFTIIALFIGIGILLLAIVQIQSLYNRFNDAKEEMNFAFQHPAIVRNIEKQYETKTAEVDQSFIAQEQQQPVTEQIPKQNPVSK